MKLIETWLSDHTSNLSELQQLVRRAECSLYIFDKITLPRSEKITWKHYKDRIFNIGPIHRWIYHTLFTAKPALKYAPIYTSGGRTELAIALNRLIHTVVTKLYQDKQDWGGYYDRSQIPEEHWDYQPETKLWAESNIIRTFKEPSYQWLRRIILDMGHQELYLPAEKENQHENQPNITNFSSHSTTIISLQMILY